MKYTKAHYEEIANILRNSSTLEEAREWFIEIFKEDNPRFDEQKFRVALLS